MAYSEPPTKGTLMFKSKNARELSYQIIYLISYAIGYLVAYTIAAGFMKEKDCDFALRQEYMKQRLELTI